MLVFGEGAAVDSILTNRTVRLLRVFVVLAMFGGFLLIGRPAHAEPIPGPGGPTPVASPFTELQVLPITGELGVSDIDAFDAPLDELDPLDGYPDATTIPTDWPVNNIGYAGIIPAADSEGTAVNTYCIDLFTSTEQGVTYERGEWSEANVRNLNYVAYILQNYYPAEPDNPPDVDDNVKAAAVQSAIWFFSDNLVINPTDESELYALTSAIVTDTLANGPATEPLQPTLDVTPQSASAPSTGELVGPFTVTADGPSILRLEGVQVFSDAAGTQQLAEGDTVAPGTQLWARSTSTAAEQGFSLQRLETIRESTVYLYDGAIPGRDAAQKLILAQDTQLEAVAGVRITQFAAGGIAVTKTITGEAAGLQGPIEIRVVCTPAGGGEAIERTVTIPAGAAAGSQTTTLTGLPAGATCVITEPIDGGNELVNVTDTSIEPSSVTVVEGVNTPSLVSNEYQRARGALQVTKRIGGPAAGEQGEIVLLIDCDDAANEFDQRLTIPAGSAAGTYPVATVTDIPAGTVCQVTETVSGVTETVFLAEPTAISPESVTIADSRTSEVGVTNIYREADDGGDDNGGDDGGGGGGDGDDGGGGGFPAGPVSDDFLPDTGAPSGTLPLVPLGIALVVAGTFVLIAERRALRRV